MKLIKQRGFWRKPVLILNNDEELAYKIGLCFGIIQGFAIGVITATIIASLIFLEHRLC